MKRIFDAEQIRAACETYQIEQYFSTPELPFLLCVFEQGELIYRSGEIAHYMHLVLEGTFIIYDIRGDGSKYTVAQSSGFSLLGDLEFADATAQSFFVEATSTVRCLSFSIADCRARLKQDTLFLNYIIEMLTKKMTAIAREEFVALTLKERILNHLYYHCQDHTLKGVERASLTLRCSSRQLQRILNELQAEMLVEKSGKGTYRLILG